MFLEHRSSFFIWLFPHREEKTFHAAYTSQSWLHNQSVKCTPSWHAGRMKRQLWFTDLTLSNPQTRITGYCAAINANDTSLLSDPKNTHVPLSPGKCRDCKDSIAIYSNYVVASSSAFLVELPAGYVHLEDCPCSLLRQHGGHQTGRANSTNCSLYGLLN